MESIPVVLIDLNNLLFKPIGWQHYFYTLIGPYLILILTDETDEGVNRIGVCTKKKTPLGVHEVIVFCAGSGRGLWQWRQPAGAFSVWKELKLPLGQNGVKWVGVLWHVSLGKGRGGRFSTKTSSTTTRKNANTRQKRPSLECTSRKCVMTKINRFVHGSRKRTSHLVSVIWLLLCVCDNYAFIICKLFSTDVFSLLKNDKSSWTRLVWLKQTLRQLIVPRCAHPLTMDTELKKV